MFVQKLGKISKLAPLRSVSFSPSFRETDAANLFFGLRFAKPKSSISIFGDTTCRQANATDLFVGLRCVKPMKPASVFSLTCVHARPEVSRRPTRRRRPPLTALLRFRSIHAFFLHFYLKKGLLLLLFLKTQMANFLTVGSLFLHVTHFFFLDQKMKKKHSSILKWEETGGEPFPYILTMRFFQSLILF